MCFSKESSMGALLLGFLSSLFLVILSKKKFLGVNIRIALIFIFVTAMQLVEYLIWSDLDCTNGNNKLAGIIGPVLNYLQPFVIFIVLGIFKYKLINLTNILYFIYFIYYYYIYYKYSSKCSKKNQVGHLSWVWSSHNNSYNNYRIILFYFIVTIINFALVIKNKSYLITFIITAICLFISNIFYSTNIGELWCLFVIIIPIILSIIQRLVYK